MQQTDSIAPQTTQWWLRREKENWTFLFLFLFLNYAF